MNETLTQPEAAVYAEVVEVEPCGLEHPLLHSFLNCELEKGHEDDWHESSLTVERSVPSAWETRWTIRWQLVSAGRPDDAGG